MSLEESILALTAAVVANTAALGAAPKAPKAKKGETSESAPTSTPVIPPATAPAGSTVTTSAPTTQQMTVTNPQLLAITTEAVIKLANEYSREKAVGLLAEYKVTRCSDLKPEQLQPVFDKASAAIAVEQAAKEAATANASLV